MNKADLQLLCIKEYINAVADYHEAVLLVEETKQRVIVAVEANTQAGLDKNDPLLVLREERTPIEAVTSKITTHKRAAGPATHRTKRIKRSSPGVTQKAVYEALPGDVHAIALRTGLSRGQVHAATGCLLETEQIERHGTRGNYTYVVAGDRVDWSAKQWAAVCHDMRKITS